MLLAISIITFTLPSIDGLEYQNIAGNTKINPDKIQNPMKLNIVSTNREYTYKLAEYRKVDAGCKIVRIKRYKKVKKRSQSCLQVQSKNKVQIQG